jgi:flagellar P-ring protein precursor FlgI
MAIMWIRILLALLPALILMPAPVAGATRLKDLVSVEGVRDNQLIGYGLVVGLAGTGDKRQTFFSAQSLTNMLTRMGVTVNPTQILVRNIAAVIVTADLPPFAQPGTHVDVTAAAIGDASDLRGGLLLMTSLKASDGQTYAVAQGPVVTGGFVAGRRGNSQTVNHPTVGRVPEGAIVERPAPSVAPMTVVKLQLHDEDFTTAARIAAALNKNFGGENVAHAESAAVVAVNTPPAYAKRPVEFVAAIESVSVNVDHPAKVVVNERTGTIVMGKDVKIAPVSILHGGLTVEIQTTYAVSQPAPFSQGQTTVTPQVGVGVKEEKAHNVVLKEGASVEDLVRALTAIGSTPRDIIAILQNLRVAGALEAELEVI